MTGAAETSNDQGTSEENEEQNDDASAAAAPRRRSTRRDHQAKARRHIDGFSYHPPKLGNSRKYTLPAIARSLVLCPLLGLYDSVSRTWCFHTFTWIGFQIEEILKTIIFA